MGACSGDPVCRANVLRVFTHIRKGRPGDLIQQHTKGEKVKAETQTRPHPRRARRATIAGLVLTALATTGALATAGPAAATASGREMGVRIWSAPTATAQNLAATGPLTATGARTATAAAGLEWCRIPANDGYHWTWVSYAGIKGWVRNDPICPVQDTYPGAPPFRLVPQC
jgi:hypothetical protein